MNSSNRILLVEDDQVVATAYRSRLQREGFEVQVAPDGKAGLEMLQTFAPDALLMDLMLPQLPGVELIKAIRSNPAHKELPIVVFSSTYLSSVVQEAWKAGATKCFAKASCNPADLSRTFRALLQPKPAEHAEPFTNSPPSASSSVEQDLQQSFIRNWPEVIVSVRSLLQNAVKSASDAERAKNVEALYRKVHLLTGSAALAGFASMAHLADALESLLRELHLSPTNVTASTLRTIASAIDLLGALFKSGISHEPVAAAKILVVDDEIISRRAVAHALSKANLNTESIDDPTRAIEMLLRTRYDLIILDVDMPGMNGYELCGRLRGLPGYQRTPVIFVTSLNDLEARASSTMSGGNDFIAKPFLFVELAVKALVFLHRAGLRG